MINIDFSDDDEGLTIEQQEHYRKLLRNIVLDAKSLYDGYPSKHQTELYNFAKDLLKVL